MVETSYFKSGINKDRNALIKHCNVFNRLSPFIKVINFLILDDILSWNIFSDHFVFKLNPNEVGSEFIYVVALRK